MTPLKGLEIGRIGKDSVEDVIPRAFDSLVYQWIAFEGPVALLCQITADTDNPFKPEDFDGICHACEVLFSSDEHQALLARALPGKRASLQLQEDLYTALGWYKPPRTDGAGTEDAPRGGKELS